MNPLSYKYLAFLMSMKISGKKIAGKINKKQILPMGMMEYLSPSNVKISVAQVAVRPYQNLSEYIDDMESYIFESMQQTCHLVCFPELCGLLPISLVPRYQRIIDKLVTQSLSRQDSPGADNTNAADTSQESTPSLNDDLLLQISRLHSFLHECYYATFSNLARRYSVYIMAGSTYVHTPAGIFNRAYLFSPEGEELLAQDKIHLCEFEKRLGIKGGKEIKIAAVPFGNAAIAIGCDNAYYEYYKIAKRLGAGIVLAPSVYWDKVKTPDGITHPQLRSQEAKVFVACSSLVGGEFLGTPIKGKSAVYAPCKLAKEHKGVVASSATIDERELIMARADLEKLSGVTDISSDDYNAACYENFIASVYGIDREAD